MQYSIRESIYKRNPTIEILVDGKEWGFTFEYDEHFRFGLNKAKMILVAMPIIDKFVDSKGTKPPLGEEVTIENNVLSEKVVCIRYDSFEYYGRTIEKPYLKLMGSYADIGFGLEKAKALMILEDEIKEFVDRNIFRRRP